MTQPVLARPARQGEPGYNPYGHSGRVYEHPLTGGIAPSITAVQGVIDKPAVDKSNLKKVAEYAADHAELFVGEFDRDALVEQLKSEPFKKTETSPSVIGDLVHGAIDQVAKGEPSTYSDAWPITAKRMWKQFNAFWDKYNPEFTHTEFTVWNHARNYAGTADWAMRIAGWHVLGDTKSGKKAYPDVGIQVSAVANADEILTQQPNGSWVSSPMFRADRFAVLHIRPSYACLLPLNRMDECYQAFCAARLIYEWQFSVAPKVIGEAPRVSVPMRETA